MRKKTTFQQRQGDLLFETVASVPNTARPTRDNVLAHGEVTGHCHQIVGDGFDHYIDDSPGAMSEGLGAHHYVRTGNTGATSKHETHGPITMPAETVTKVTRQRSLDFATLTPRVVAD